MSPENNEENDGNENAEDNHIDIGDGNNDEVRSSRLQRHQLTKKGIVNSIDTAVDIDSYNPFPILGNLKTYENIFKVNNNKRNDVICTFQNFPPRGNVGRNNHAFVFIHAHLSFNDKTTRENRWQQDSLAAIREVFEVFNFKCMPRLVPGDYLSLDETLYPMRT